MTLRAPSVPLITVDPYFSVWSAADKLTDQDPVHWTGKPNTIRGAVFVDGTPYRFMGEGDLPALEQTSLTVSALCTTYLFAGAGVCLRVDFFSTLFCDDLYLLSRPCSYMHVSYTSTDGKAHDVRVQVTADETLCTDKAGDQPVAGEVLRIGNIRAGKLGTVKQAVLNRSGDDVRIDWGYFYLCTEGEVTAADSRITAEADVPQDKGTLFVFAYDDVHALIYFEKPVDAYWRSAGKDMEKVIAEAFGDYERLHGKAVEFSARLYADAVQSGGEQYAELLALAYRQVIAAHKLCLADGAVIFVSKECFSNGCAATVDVTYPSAPMFLYYNTELLKGMLRPVFRYAESDAWTYDFAPHDVGQYPILNGQVYADNKREYQMPVEECGNMIILCAAITKMDGNAAFVKPYMDTLTQWCDYLLEYGEDPGNQLCTDDFAGHLAHNCNLSLKAIYGVEGLSYILGVLGDERAGEYHEKAKHMAESWTVRADNGDGSFRLAFDRPGTFSMKYNMIWEKFFKTGLFPSSVLYAEFSSYARHQNPYGLPLDSRSDYTKSDWLLWCACMAYTKAEFEAFIEPLWLCYHKSPSRVPMTDWYYSSTSVQCSFQHRTVQGGLFLKLLLDEA